MLITPRVSVWLASDGVLEIAITGKPVSYGICVDDIDLSGTTDLCVDDIDLGGTTDL